MSPRGRLAQFRAFAWAALAVVLLPDLGDARSSLRGLNPTPDALGFLPGLIDDAMTGSHLRGDGNHTRRLYDFPPSFGLSAIQLKWTRSADSVGWSKGSDPMHDLRAPCIHPPPFGQQCTVHRVDALTACLFLGCHSVVCPDQTPYAKGKPAKHIEGPICQVRAHGDANEKNHGMCKPGG